MEGNQIHNYEVKRTDHDKAREKANSQLFKAREYWSNQGENNIWSYYVHGNFGQSAWHYDVELVTGFNPLTFTKFKHYKVGR